MGLLACVLRPSGPTHGKSLCSFLSSPRDMIPMVPNLISRPLSAWQVSINPNQPDLPTLAKLPSALSNLK
jgi:hypothetical protein